MIHGASQVGVGEGNSAEWGAAQNFAGRGLAVASEEKAWLWIQVGVSPAVQDDCGDIPLGAKARVRKHGVELFADALLIFAERNAQHFRAAALSLLFGR